jgi:hypothetical protein
MAITAKTGKPSTGMVYTEDQARRLALSLKVQCQFGNPGCTYRASCDCPYVCTPPAENSNPSGASDGADGQGACIPKRSSRTSIARAAAWLKKVA